MGTGASTDHDTEESCDQGWRAVPVPEWDTVPRAVAELPWRTPAWWQQATVKRWPGLLVASVLSATVAVLATLAVVTIENPPVSCARPSTRPR